MTKTWKRIAALAVLALFIMSIVPVAFAERDERKELSDRGEQVRIKKDAALEQIKEVRENIKDKKEMLREVKETFKEKKELYQEAKQAFQEKKEQLAELKQKARCNENTAECQTKKIDLKKGVREHLVKTIELIDSSLAKLQEQVTQSKVLTEEERQEALDKIAVLEEKLTAKKKELEALSDSMTNEELRTQIKELKELWHTVQKEQRWIVTQLINSKQDNLVDIYVRYGERAQAQITKLKEQGADVTSLQEMLAKYNTKMEELKRAQTDARTAWMEAKSNPDALEKAKELQKIFREKAKETKTVLRELLQKVKEVQKQVRDDREPENGNATTQEPATAQ